MTLIAPVNLPYNVKTLWFDPNGIDIHPGDRVVVETARGVELGVAQSDPKDVPEEKVEALKSPLMPVLRVATEEDLERSKEMERLASEAMPIFRELAHETSEDMHPVSVEYMLDGDKAVFYFESEKRIDFRELVRKLASKFHVRIDMKQIGVRDEARIVGGLAHCGQLVCCKRLGGEFKPVTIRMAKDQDLSLNSQKISGLCGRLMCCLRYEEQTYREVKAESPKMGAKVTTPQGDGKVVGIDVPTETISVKVEDEKPVKIPLSAFEDMADDRKSCAVPEEAWTKAIEDAAIRGLGTPGLFDTPSFTKEDKLGTAQAIHHEGSSRSSQEKGASKKSRTGRGRSDSGQKSSGKQPSQTKMRQRRRSTKISASSGEKETVAKKRVKPGHRSSGLSRIGEEEGKATKARKHTRREQTKQTKQQDKAQPSKDAANSEDRKPARRRRRPRKRQGGESQKPAAGASDNKD